MSDPNPCEVFVLNQVLPTLEKMNDFVGHPGRYNSPAAIKLLTMIAAHESHFEHRVQIGGGPALSYYQIERETLDDLYTSYLSFRPSAQDMLDGFMLGDDRYAELRDNDRYATCVARLQLWRKPEPLPSFEDDEGLADYAKEHWNTQEGAATPEKYLNDFVLFGPKPTFWEQLDSS